VATKLWTPSPDEQALLRADFELFVRSYFRRGQGAAITGHQGQVLQVRPKGRNAADRRRAFGPSGEPTQIGKCGFYLRPAFVASILRGKWRSRGRADGRMLGRAEPESPKGVQS
jgi:DNA mismatch repair protein MutH